MKQLIKHGATIETATISEIADLLRESSTSEHVAFGGDSIERTVENWPVVGHERKVRATRTQGDDNLVIAAATYTDVLDQDMGRGGLSMMNIGANPCFVYLAAARDAKDRSGKVAAGYLAPGASWDGRISDQMWVGPVSVRSVLGTTLVLGAI